MSNLSYCPLKWHFCIEKIQERALRFIYDYYTNFYNFLLDQSKLPTLKIRRMRTMALDSFKIVNKSSPEFIQNNITIKETSYKTQLIIPRPRTTKYHKTKF
jgi:hypothetical protein